MSATPFWRRYLRFWGDDPAADVDDEFAFHCRRASTSSSRRPVAARARDDALRGFGDIER